MLLGLAVSLLIYILVFVTFFSLHCSELSLVRLALDLFD